jgi:hypothetical protein
VHRLEHRSRSAGIDAIDLIKIFRDQLSDQAAMADASVHRRRSVLDIPGDALIGEYERSRRGANQHDNMTAILERIPGEAQKRSHAVPATDHEQPLFTRSQLEGLPERTHHVENLTWLSVRD